MSLRIVARIPQSMQLFSAAVKQGINPKATQPSSTLRLSPEGSLRPEPFGSELKAELLRPRGTSIEPQSNSSSRAEALNTKQHLNPNAQILNVLAI